MKLRLFSSAVASLVMVLGASAADYSAETLSLMSVSDGSDTFCRVTGLDDPDASTVERVAHEGKYGNNIYPVTWGDRVYMTSCSQGASSENFFTITDNNLAMIAQASLGLDNPGHHVLPLTETSGYVSSFRHLYKYTVGDAGIELAPIAEGAFGHLAAIDGKLYVTYVESPAQSFTYAQMKTVKVFSLADDSEIKTIDCADKIDAGYAINKAVLALDGKIYLGILACDYSHYTDPCAKFMLSLDPATDTVTRIDFPDGVVGNASNIMNFNNATLIASTVTPVLYWIGNSNSAYHIYRYDLATGNIDIVVDGWEGERQGCPVYKGSFIESPVTGILYHGCGDWGSAKLYSWNPADSETKTMYPQVKNIEGSIALFFNHVNTPKSMATNLPSPPWTPYAEVFPGQTRQVELRFDDACDVRGMIWSTSDPTVATVDFNGKITGVSVGKAVVTATSIGNTSKSISCDVTVAKQISMFREEYEYTIEGESYTVRNLPKDEKNGLFGYEYDSRNWHTVKLHPATPGKKVQIDISKLNFAGDDPETHKYYQEDDQPQFYIYNGSAEIVFENKYLGKINYDDSKFGECLYVWSYADNGKEVGEVYRSTADDGSLTIMFWHGGWGWRNGDVQSGSEYGFTATVSEVSPKDMEAVEAEMSRKKAWVPTVPTPTAVPVLDFFVKTDGALNASSLTSVTVDLKGNSANIASLELFAAGIDVMNTAGKSLGRVDVTEGKEDYTFAVSDGVLADGRNHYHVVADLRDDLADHADLTVKMADVKVGESSLKLVNEDPEALVEARTWYYMQPGDNEILIGNNPVTFYDSNKIGGCYDLTSGTVTFAPRDPDAKIMVTVASRPELAAGDNLDMFSGKTTDKGAKVQTFKYNTKESLFPYSYTSEAADGSVTFEFVPTSEDAKYGKKTGWAIKVECYKNVSGIDEVEIDVNAPVDVYDIRGILVGQAATVADITATLPSGVYIVKQGTAVRKLLVK